MIQALTAPADPLVRAAALLDAYRAAPRGTDIAIYVGAMEGKAAIIVKVGSEPHPFFTDEARDLADSIEAAIHASGPGAADIGSAADLAMALRAGADKAESNDQV